jgi:hypothetical protein
MLRPMLQLIHQQLLLRVKPRAKFPPKMMALLTRAA